MRWLRSWGARIEAWLAALSHMVDGLDLREGGLYADTFHVSGRRTGEAKPDVLYQMLQSERAHLVRVAEVAAKAGVGASYDA